MATTHDNKSNEIEVSIEPAVLTSVKIRYVDKTIEVPSFIPVSIEKPIFTDKEYERPIITDKEYEKPVIKEKVYEKPVVVIKETEYEKPVIVEKVYEKPVIKEKVYEKPVITEKEITVLIPKEVSYDLPIVSMEKLTKVSEDAVAMLDKAKATLAEVNDLVEKFKAVVKDAKDKLPAEIRVPKIVHEEVIVKDVKIVEETKYVIGKIIAKEA